MGQDPKPSARQKAAAKRMRSAVDEIPQTPAIPVPGQVELAILLKADKALRALEELLGHEAGFIRMGHDKDGFYVWLTFKWLRGRHAGFYVHDRCLPPSLAEGLERLLEKVTHVELGLVNPTFDHGPRP